MPRSLSAALVLLMLALALRPARSEDDGDVNLPAGPKAKELSRRGVKAISRGLAYLARHQEENGSFKANVGYKLNSTYVQTKQDVGHPGVTALAGMAFLAAGYVPGRGKYGRNVGDAVKYILSCEKDGMITAHGTRMYSHAFATLFLAEVYGMTRDARARGALEAATEFTWKCQNQAGAWRYVPYAQDSDMSITVCQVMALRAARNIGIPVPRKSIDKAVNYVLESANTSPREEEGGFKYQYRAERAIPTRNSFALTAAGLATLYSAGLYTDQDILAHIKKHNLTRFLRADPPPRMDKILRYIMTRYGTTPRRSYFYYYGNYYAVQALFIAGGELWKDYFERVQRDLVDEQNDDGSWSIRSDQDVGSNYATASASLILLIPYRYLPIFQR